MKWGAGANPALAGVAGALWAAGSAAAARASALSTAAAALAAHAHVAAALRAPRAPPRHYAQLTTALAHWEKVTILPNIYVPKYKHNSANSIK